MYGAQYCMPHLCSRDCSLQTFLFEILFQRGRIGNSGHDGSRTQMHLNKEHDPQPGNRRHVMEGCSYRRECNSNSASASSWWCTRCTQTSKGRAFSAKSLHGNPCPQSAAFKQVPSLVNTFNAIGTNSPTMLNYVNCICFVLFVYSPGQSLVCDTTVNLYGGFSIWEGTWPTYWFHSTQTTVIYFLFEFINVAHLVTT